MTSTLAVIVLTAVYSMYATGHTIYRKGLTRADVQQNARIALDLITREIRMAGYESPSLANPACDPPKTASCILSTQQTSKIGIVADVDGDDTTEEVEYELRNCANGLCELSRRERNWDGVSSTWGAWSSYQLVASNVKGLTFTYSTKSVSVQVEVQETASGKQESFTVVSDVRLRNLL